MNPARHIQRKTRDCNRFCLLQPTYHVKLKLTAHLKMPPILAQHRLDFIPNWRCWWSALNFVATSLSFHEILDPLPAPSKRRMGQISAPLEVMISSLGSFWSAWGSVRAHPELKCFKDSWKRYNSREVQKSRAFSRKISNLSCTSWLTMPYRLALRFRKRLHRDLPCPTAPLYALDNDYIVTYHALPPHSTLY